MTAQLLSEDIYNRLVTLPYSRKINFNSECHTEVDFAYLPKDVQAAVQTFPILEKTETDWMAIEGLDSEQQFFIFSDDDGLYLVDTQGYDYPRYVTRLTGFDNVTVDPKFEMFERAEGLVRIADSKIFKQVIGSMAQDLYDEGFDGTEIVDYLRMKVLESLKMDFSGNK